MPSRTPKRTSGDRRFGEARTCTVCSKPILAVPGTRHASCSPRCTVCYDPVLSGDLGDKTHDACSRKRRMK